MNGIEHIAETFGELRRQQRAALMPYMTLGFPTLQDTTAVLEAVASAGADLIELGVPFSDPLADGPTIQHSTQRALEQGITVRRCLELVRELRGRGVTQPLILMGYINPILAFGLERYAREAGAAGADGLIVPDLPMEEAGQMEAACRANGMALVLLAAPTSTPERLEALAAHTSGFLYLVSVAGVTGARDRLPDGLEAFVRRAKDCASTPVAVGFGISTPQQAREVGALADGVIIGSALIRAVEGANDPAAAAREYIRSIRAAMDVRIPAR